MVSKRFRPSLMIGSTGSSDVVLSDGVADVMSTPVYTLNPA